MATTRGIMNCGNPPCDVNKRVSEDGSVSGLMMCSGCKKAAYCSKQCQKEHWPAHKVICKALKENADWPTMDAITYITEETKIALYGDHAPVSERIRWHSVLEGDAKSRIAMQFMEKLDKEQVAQYAVEKFLADGKGAVMFNINRPLLQFGGSARFSWAPLSALMGTKDDLLIRSGRDYDPLRCCIMIFLKPSEDRLSVDVWSQEAYFTLPAFIQDEVRDRIQEWDAMMAREARKKARKHTSK